jgi:hypothetical protein
MARKRASLKDKGEEILGLKRGGQGADLLFGLDAESTGPAESEESPDAETPQKEDLLQGEADLDETAGSGDKPTKKGKNSAAGSEPVTAKEGLPQAEADLNEQELEELLGAEAKAGEGEEGLPQLATTPAAAAPPPLEPTTRPPTLKRPLPAPPPVPPAKAAERPAPVPPLASRTAAPTPKAAERPLPAPPPPNQTAAPRPQATNQVEGALPPPLALPGSPPTDLHPPAGVPPSSNAVAAQSPGSNAGPPSTATGAPDLSVPRPPRRVQLIDEDFDVLVEEPVAEAAAAEEVGPPEALPLTEEQKEELLRRRAVQQEFKELAKEIDAQYERILRENVSVSKPITDWAQNLLAEARGIVLAEEVAKLPIAEWDVEQVRARLDRAYESQEQAKRYSVPILIWGFAWFLLFVYLVFNPTLVLQLLHVGNFSDVLLDPQIFLQALFFGGIGGVAAVFYHLFKYMRARSFDSQYVLSYFGKPINGMIVGSIVYLTVFGARFVGLAVFQGQEPLTDITGLRLVIYVLAIAAGFKENLAFDLLNRIVKAVLGSQEEQAEGEEPIGQPPTPPNTAQ